MLGVVVIDVFYVVVANDDNNDDDNDDDDDDISVPIVAAGLNFYWYWLLWVKKIMN